MSSIRIVHGDCLDVFKDVRGLASIVSSPPGGNRAYGGRDGWIAAMTPRFKAAREATERGAYGLFRSFPRTAHWTACALDDAGWHIVGDIRPVQGQGWAKYDTSQLKRTKETWLLVQWGGATPLRLVRGRVRHSLPAALQAENSAPGFSGAEDQTTEHMGDGDVGARLPDLALMHCFACLDGTEALPAWSCLAACACGLASLSPARGAPERCPGCGQERWWACPVAEMNEQSGEMAASWRRGERGRGIGHGGGDPDGGRGDPDDVSDFFPTFHCDARASTRERQSGCEGLLWVKDKTAPIGWRRVSAEEHLAAPKKDRAQGNVCTTGVSGGFGEEDGFARWGVRLVTPPGGRVGDPFVGPGTTAVACQIEGHPFDGCDIDPGAVEIALARVVFWTPERHRLERDSAAALRASEKRKREAEARGQLDWTKGL